MFKLGFIDFVIFLKGSSIPAEAELAGLEGEDEAKGENLVRPSRQRDSNLEPVRVRHRLLILSEK
jgi:hypothetical protein